MTHSTEGLSAQFDASPADLMALYDDWASGYDADVASWGYEVPAWLTGALQQHDGPHGLVLDAGCGTGGLGVALAAADREAVGVDFSGASLDLAASRHVYSGVLQADLNQPLPFAANTFAAVGSAGVFTYLPDIAPVLTELIRVTMPGGLIVFSQRTDLWEQRDSGSAIAQVVADETCDATISDPQPYLPGHPEYGDDIGVRYTAITVG